MNTNPEKVKQFFQQLVQYKQLDLTQVVAIFCSDISTLKIDDMCTLLRHMQGENIFLLKHKKNSKSIFIDKKIFDHIDDYSVIFNGFVEDDIERSESFTLQVEEDSVTKIENHNHIAILKPWMGTRIIGDYMQSPNAYERLRAFTQLFANLLTQKKYAQLEPLISQEVVSQYSAGYFSLEMQKQEAIYGEFDFFDHLRIEQLYEGSHCDKKYFDDMKIPKGVSLSARVGISSFKLISVYSPNGIMHNYYTLYLSVINENGFYKVCGCKWSEND